MNRALDANEIELFSNSFFSPFEKIDLIYCEELQKEYFAGESDLRENLTTIIE
jgi:hypothetical protein